MLLSHTNNKLNKTVLIDVDERVLANECVCIG